MKIEEQIFKNAQYEKDKLIEYGFVFNKNKYTFQKNIEDDKFTVLIEIHLDNLVLFQIIDVATNEEYLAYRINNNQNSFVNQIKKQWIDLLYDVKQKCFSIQLFVFEQTNRIVKLIEQTYNDKPQFLWKNFNHAVFKNPLNFKWYCVIVSLKKDGQIKEMINVKLEQDLILKLINQKGFEQAYHMNKKHWISINLNDSLEDQEIIDFVKQSYLLTTY